MTNTSFEFNIETNHAIPARGGSGRSKYDWASFPAPKAKDPNPPSAFIPDVSPKTIYNSVKSYKKKLLDAGHEEESLPHFRVSQVRDEKTGEPSGVRVFRVS